MRSQGDDQGSILVLTILLTVVLAAIVLALATYSIAGLRSSDITTQRIEDDVAMTNAVNWAVEEFAAKHLLPDDACGESPTVIDIPNGLVDGAGLACEQEVESEAGHPQVRLIATVTSASGQERFSEVVLEVPIMSFEAHIRSWLFE
jgi:hypothetical protein